MQSTWLADAPGGKQWDATSKQDIFKINLEI